MLLYDKKHTYGIVCGILALCLGLLAIGFVWLYRRVIRQSDYSFLLLIVPCFLGAVAYFIMLIKSQATSRYFIRYKTSNNGIVCRKLGQRWQIPWDKICIYGTVGYTPDTGMGLMFFSTDSSEIYDQKTCANNSEKRIVFQINDANMAAIFPHLPEKAVKNIETSIHEKRNCYYRMKSKKTEC